MRELVEILRNVAVFLRQVAALGALLLAVRVLWLSGIAGLAQVRSEANNPKESAAERGTPRAIDGTTQHRPDLEELGKLVGAAKPDPTVAPPPPVPALRRILVDVGPPRSEVFIGRTKVGHTPYGGQIACTAEEEVKIQILPPQGVPLLRRVTCRGDTLLVRE